MGLRYGWDTVRLRYLEVADTLEDVRLDGGRFVVEMLLDEDSRLRDCNRGTVATYAWLR